jgi:ATP-dependent Clp protease ATP-binding subunit ClpB
MTSNLGSDIILDGIGENGEIEDKARETVTGLLRRSFRPEFLNRIDETVFYKPLTKDNIYGIVDLLIADLSARLQGRHIGIRVTDAAKDLIIESAYDPIYGARPLKRFLQSRVETLIARKMIAEDIAPESILVIDAQNGVLSVNTAD